MSAEFSRRDMLKSGGLFATAVAAGSGVVPSLTSVARGEEPAPLGAERIIARSINSDPDHIPTLFGRIETRQTGFVSAVFPHVPGLRLDICAFEATDGFLPLELLGMALPEDNKLVLTHRVKNIPGLVHVTTMTAEATSIEAVGRLAIDRRTKQAAVKIPENLTTPNMCWSFQKSPNFVAGGVADAPYGETPDVYPRWVERCFIFTDRGQTFLDRTIRQKSDEVKPDDPRNNPVWSQHYVGVWQPIASQTLPANTSPTRYVAPVIGAVSNDGKHLVALASDSPRYIAQAWHTCLHHVVSWMPADGPMLERQWKMRLYAMANEPLVLMARLANDFPQSMKLKNNAVASGI